MILRADGNLADILPGFGGDRQQAKGLTTFLRFERVSNPEDELAATIGTQRGHTERGT